MRLLFLNMTKVWMAKAEKIKVAWLVAKQKEVRVIKKRMAAKKPG